MIFSIEKRRFRRGGKLHETRSYYLRYRIGDMPVERWKSLGVTDKQVKRRTCPATLGAFDAGGKMVNAASVAAVPARTSPGDPVPSFELTVKAAEIASVCFRGLRTGEFLAEEVRYTPSDGSTARAPAAR